MLTLLSATSLVAIPAMAQETTAERPVVADEALYDIIIEENVMIPMSDGTLLAADIFRPDSDDTFPVIVERTPYGKSGLLTNIYFAERGYVFVAQDVRGRNNSEGDWYPFLNEGWLENKDGYDTVEWLAEQPWSNGRVGVYGGSHTGYNAYLVGPAQPPAMTSMFAREAASDLRDHWVH